MQDHDQVKDEIKRTLFFNIYKDEKKELVEMRLE